MPVSFDQAYDDVRRWAAGQGIDVREQPLPPGTAGQFTGTAVAMNPGYSPEERMYYLVHALGSIVLWSRNREAVQQMFDDLREAKKKDSNVDELETRIQRYRDFEIESSELAVWLLGELGHADAVGHYTNFMRADLESMTEFHRTGRAPVWKTFFARWNDDVAHGRRTAPPFRARPIPPFTPVPIEKQEILQEQPK